MMRPDAVRLVYRSFMKRDLSRRRLLAIPPAAALAASALAAEQSSGASGKEARGVWIHPERSFPAEEKEGRAKVRAIVERYARANFNLLLPWTRSEYLAALESPEYAARHPIARWDALGALIEEARRVGIGVDMWYSFTDYRSPSSPEFNPAVGGDPGWAARKFPVDTTGPDRVMNVCPQHYQARTWQMNQLIRALARYSGLRGLHIEEPGYREKGYCACDLCQRVFLELHGNPLPENLDSQEAQDFRTIGASAFVWELLQAARAKHPKLVFSANGGHDWEHDRMIGRDWGRWGRAGWLRYFAPQVYVTGIDEFRRKTQKTMTDLGSACPVYVGIGFEWSTGRNTPAEVVRQIEQARSIGAPGVILFHGAAFTDEMFRLLEQGPFRKRAELV